MLTKIRSIFILLAALAGQFSNAQTTHAVTISTLQLAPGTVGTAYNVTVFASGGTAPYTWTLNGILPAGLGFSGKGVISGMPTKAGTFGFGLTAQDSLGSTSPLTNFSITVNTQGLAITTVSPLPSGIASVEYPAVIFGASGGVSPYTFTANSGVPPGMAVADGLLGGTPTTPGSYSISLTVTDATGKQASSTLAVTIRQATTDLQLSSGSLSFSLADIATVPPASKTIKVQSSLVGQPLGFLTSMSPAVTWLSVTGGVTTPSVLTVAVTNAALLLGPGIYTTTLAITCETSPCVAKALQVPVTLTITVAPAKLKVLNDVLSYAADPSIALSAQALSQQLQVKNTGGAALTVNSITCAASWCSAAMVPGSIGGGATTPVNVNLNPASLNPGSYRTNVTVNSAAGVSSTPVTLVVPRKPSIQLGTSGAQFTMPAGGPLASSTGSFRLAAVGGSISWAATAVSKNSWLTITTASGIAAPSQPATVQYSLNNGVVSTFAPGTYYGAITLTANGVTNSPQDFRVILTVNPVSNPVRPQLAPGGLVLAATAAKVTGTVNVLADSTAAVTYQAAVETTSGGSWLTVAPSVGTTSAAAPAVSTVTADPTGLAPGIYTGDVNYAFAGAAIRTLNVTFLVTAAGSQVTAHELEPHELPHSTCAPSALAIGQTGLVNNFSEPTSWPVPIAINLLNNCGAYVSNGQVVVTFSNGDPPMSLSLVDPSSGLYSATWTPRRQTSDVVVTTTATVAGLPAASAIISGEVLPNAVPSLNAYAVLNVFNPLVGAALAPGTVVALYGANLASVTGQPSTVPLPQSLNGTQVIVGGIAAPLYYASSGQINAQIPFELDSESQYSVVISANGALTTPQAIQLTPASPGIAANADTTILAQHAADYSLISAASPAQPGEYIVLYLAGMGAMSTQVRSGDGSPSAPLASIPPSQVTLTIDSAPVTVAFSGLTPGAVGLYQIDVQLPASLSNGNHQLTVSSMDGRASNSTLLAVHN